MRYRFLRYLVFLLVVALSFGCADKHNVSNHKESSQGDPGTSSNSIQVIWPYNVQGTWVFDDAEKGLKREPFVGAINTMIDNMVTNIPNAKIGFRLLFSAGFIPGHDLKIVWKRKDVSGNWYWCEKYKVEGWLCPALLKYFEKPPKEIYVKAESLPEGVVDKWKKKKRKW